MKKIITLALVIATSTFLFSCGNGKSSKNGDNKDSIATSSTTATTQATENFETINSFDFCLKLVKDKKYANETLDKTVILTDLILAKYEYNSEFTDGTILTIAFNPKENKSLYGYGLNDYAKNNLKLNGKHLDFINDGKFYYMGGDRIEIHLKDHKQFRSIESFDASTSYNDFDPNYKEILKKVKGTIKYGKGTQNKTNDIVLENAEILK